ncbi:hypothetical protein ASE75_05945 [Sphingomonas sp. Leaf17]|uniref:hypothetical protein n=1 Tax=Sphingomonas sp. Leaf17 TaxID=1735683 RepID=UPI0006FFD001|nr:hypothetical protein [Sphingomonas sp. Leaf17]KQM65771.1 hypothetical protein ASE75_05945 [Sphingomonas sp. Leaf17]
MSLFAVVSQQLDNTAAVDAALRTYPGKSNRWSTTLAVVAASGTAQSLVSALALEDDQRHGLFVVRLSPDYYGYSSTAFWDWIKETFQADANG